MRISIAALLGMLLFFTATAQAQDDAPPAQTLDTVPLGDLLDDSYEIRSTVVNMLILQKRKSAYACNLVARTLADVENWIDAECVKISAD